VNHYDISLVPLKHASLCMDCEVITAADHNVCLCCGSRALLNVAQVLDKRAFLASHSEQPLTLSFPALRRHRALDHPLRHKSKETNFPLRIVGSRARNGVQVG
jgi:hypothetical protein